MPGLWALYHNTVTGLAIQGRSSMRANTPLFSLKRSHILLLFPFLSVLLILLALPATIVLANHQTRLEQQAAGFSSPPAIFDGVNVDMCLLNPNSPDYVKNSNGQDLIEIAAHLGINFFRINDGGPYGCTNGGSAFGGAGTASNWGLVLNKMAQYGIQAQIVSGHTGGFATSSISSTVSKVIDNRLGSYPNVYGYSLVNEPEIQPNITIPALLQAQQQIKAVYPNLRLTVDGWKVKGGTYGCGGTGYCWQRPQDAALLASVVDYYSPHIYGFDRPTNGLFPNPVTFVTNYIDQVLAAAPAKPIIIGEYGAANGYEFTDSVGQLGSPELQANATSGVLQAVRSYMSKGLLGSAQWAFFNRSTSCCGTPGWDLLYNHGNMILPAAYVIQKDETGTSDIPLTLPLPIIHHDYIYQLASNGTSVSIPQSGYIGLDLNLVAGNSYSLQISNPSLFTVTESFTGTDGGYKGVLHPVSPGTATVSVITQNCTANCQVFQMTFAISPVSITPAPTVKPQVSPTLTSVPSRSLTPTPSNTPPTTMVPTATNILQNPSFDSPTGISPWSFNVNSGAVATISQDITTAEDGADSAKIAITTNNPSLPWSIQLRQPDLTFTSNTTYLISFWAKGSTASLSTPQKIDIGLRENRPPNTVYCLVTNIAITSSAWQQHKASCSVKTVDATSTTSFLMDLGKASGTIWIDNVSITQ